MGGLHVFAFGKLKFTCTEVNLPGTAAAKTVDKIRPKALRIRLRQRHNSNGEAEDATLSIDYTHEGCFTTTNASSTCVIHISDTSRGETVNQNLHGVTYDKQGSSSTEGLLFTTTVTGIR